MWQVVGQEKAVSLLQHSLQMGTLAHAYLLVGPRHVGKMTLAINLAQALNCDAPDGPCGVCGSCQKIASAKHADVQVIGLAQGDGSVEGGLKKEIGIDLVRQMQHSCSLPPFEGRHKVFIIDGAECLSGEAANCLLKTLEEPPVNVVFVLLTISDRLLPETVVSRCQRLELSPLSVGEAEAALCRNWNVESQKAKSLSRLSHGCLGWAVLAASGGDLLNRRAEMLDKLYDIVGAGYLERFAHVAQLVAMFRQRRDLVYEVLDLWLEWWRDLILIKVGCVGSIINFGSESMLTRMAEEYSLSQIRGFIEDIQAAGEQLRQNANPQLVLEVLMLSIPGRKNG